MAPLMGARSWQWFSPTYGEYVRPCRGQQRAHEKRTFIRSLHPEGLLPTAEADDGHCVHACHGECMTGGSETCTFACHELTL